MDKDIKKSISVTDKDAQYDENKECIFNCNKRFK